MARIPTVAALCCLIAIPAAGCLVMDTSETWYLNGSGDVTWVITDKDVRSDANALADRQQEENEYWLAVQQQRHPAAAGLQELGGTKLRTLVLRNESPYTVQTDAHFTGLDDLGRRIISASGMMGTSLITRDTNTWTWTMVVRDPSALMSAAEPSEGVSALANNLDALHVVLTAGRFESAQGFTISGDRRVATFIKKADWTHEATEEPAITLKLVWR